MQREEVAQRLNELIPSWIDNYTIQSFDGSRLLLIGSFDLSYYYDLKVEFLEVSFIQCSTYFHANHFRAANAEETGRFHHVLLDNERHHIVCIESDEQTYYIIAENWVLTEEKVRFQEARTSDKQE